MMRFLLRSSLLVLVSGFLAATGAQSQASSTTTNASTIETGDMSAQRVVRRTTVVRGPAVVRRTTVVRPAVVGPVRWARPGNYYWRRGGAIAAGAAIGVVAAATAAAWAGQPPAPGMCWYYTDPSRTQGFWDYCR
jgi:hypothetical protein